MLIDTHCHLDSKYAQDADAVLQRATEAGVVAFVCVGVGGADAATEAVALASRQPNVVATVGVHPHDAAASTPELEALLETLGATERVVAIGEIGLDYHYDHSPRAVQSEVFRRYIALAKALKKPIVVHTRSAAEDTLSILREENARDVGGIIHCFSEDRAFAERALDMNFDLSFSGILTFKTAHQIQEAARTAPRERILVETDSPYLAPVPKRGKRCEPAFVVHTARFLAELRGSSFEEIAALTSENACRRLGTPLARAAKLVQTSS
jgi:TatD DNase family protein